MFFSYLSSFVMFYLSKVKKKIRKKKKEKNANGDVRFSPDDEQWYKALKTSVFHGIGVLLQNYKVDFDEKRGIYEADGNSVLKIVLPLRQ